MAAGQGDASRDGRARALPSGRPPRGPSGRAGYVRGVSSPEQCQALEPIVRILDPGGQPLAGATISGATSTDLIRECWWQSRQTGVFRVAGLTHHRNRILTIHHEGRCLAGTLAVRDAEPGPLVARLRPWGTVSGRLVDTAGRLRH